MQKTTSIHTGTLKYPSFKLSFDNILSINKHDVHCLCIRIFNEGPQMYCWPIKFKQRWWAKIQDICWKTSLSLTFGGWQKIFFISEKNSARLSVPYYGPHTLHLQLSCCQSEGEDSNLFDAVYYSVRAKTKCQ